MGIAPIGQTSWEMKEKASQRTKEAKNTSSGFKLWSPIRSRRWSVNGSPQIRNAGVYTEPEWIFVSSHIWRHKHTVIRHLTGRVAQRESTAFTRQGSLVQSQSRPPFTVINSETYSGRSLKQATIYF